MVCPEPETIPNGQVTLDQQSRVFEDTISYACHSGYTFAGIGDLNRECEYTGSWSGRKPVCERKLSVVYEIYHVNLVNGKPRSGMTSSSTIAENYLNPWDIKDLFRCTSIC